MLETVLIFVVSGIFLFILIRWLVKGESESADVSDKLRLYGGSELFEAHYAKNAYKKLSKVIKLFEEKYPVEVAEMQRKQQENDRFFSKNRDRYNYLIFKYQEELTDLRATHAKWFSKNDLAKYFEDKSVKELIEGHVINSYDNKYLIKEVYEAEHPFELDENGQPLKIKI